MLINHKPKSTNFIEYGECGTRGIRRVAPYPLKHIPLFVQVWGRQSQPSRNCWTRSLHIDCLPQLALFLALTMPNERVVSWFGGFEYLIANTRSFIINLSKLKEDIRLSHVIQQYFRTDMDSNDLVKMTK